VLLTYVPFAIAVCVKVLVATAGEAYWLLAVSTPLVVKSFVPNVRSLPKAAHYSLSVWPSDDQELVEHSSSERNTAPPRAFAPDRCDEVSISSGVSWKCKTEEHAATVLEGVERDARFGIGIRGWHLCSRKRCENAEYKARALHLLDKEGLGTVCF